MIALDLQLLDDRYAVCRLPAAAPFPDWPHGPLLSLTRTADELSIVCLESAVPADIRAETGWRCLRVAGSMDFALVGVVAGLTQPLAQAGISLFVLSTFDTDYLLVKEEVLARACAVLCAAGHRLVAAARFAVHRQDDNGNHFVMEKGLSRAAAEALVATYEGRGHKQVYWIEPEEPA